ncbi:hypothetical protein MCEMSE15_02488 [Fimbriimonadaceae bacterium]
MFWFNKRKERDRLLNQQFGLEKLAQLGAGEITEIVIGLNDWITTDERWIEVTVNGEKLFFGEDQDRDAFQPALSFVRKQFPELVPVISEEWKEAFRVFSKVIYSVQPRE